MSTSCARSNGHATDDLSENADRTKERPELSSAKPTSTVGDRRTYEFNPDLPQRPHRQPLGKRSSQARRQSASPRRLGSRLLQYTTKIIIVWKDQ